MEAEEQPLIRLAQHGDDEALAELLRRHYPFVRNYMIKWTMDPETAQEMTQEAMMRAVTHIRSYDGSSKLSSWLITIASRLYLDECRRRKRERRWRQEQRQSARRMRWTAEASGSEWRDVMDALAELEPETRAAILLKHYYGYGYEEIGRMLGCPEGTAKSRVFHGIRKLRKEWNNDGERTQ